MIKVRKDLTGKRFGKLVVLRQSENDYVSPKGKQHAVWWCQCDCGSAPVEIKGYSLTSGDTKSCGCFRKEIVAKQGRLNKTENKYEKYDGYYIGYTDKNEPFYFDECDFEIVKQYKWHIRSDGYLESFDSDHRRVLMHRLVMGVLSRDQRLVDHILGVETRNDNRKYNLRVVTKSQNNMNRDLGKNNKSGVLGVSWDNTRGKWRAYIDANKHRFELGYYDCIEQATKVRKEAENILHGNFSYHNSQLIGNERLHLFEMIFGASNKENSEIIDAS